MYPFYKRDLKSKIMLLLATYSYIDPSIEDIVKENEKENPYFDFFNDEYYQKMKENIPIVLELDIDSYNPKDIIANTKKINYDISNFMNFKLLNLKTKDSNYIYEVQSLSEIKNGVLPKKWILKSELKIWIVEIPEYGIKPHIFNVSENVKTIGELKANIKEKLGIPSSKIHVFCDSKIMRNSEKLLKTSYQVKYKR